MTKKTGWKLTFIAVAVGLVFSSVGCALLGGVSKPTAQEELPNPYEVQEEYTLVYRGDVQGTVTIHRDRGGKITVTPDMTKIDGVESIDNTLCPLIPAVPEWAPTLSISKYNASIVIEGNTTTVTYPDGSGSKTAIQGNTATETRSSGWWQKTVVEGNTITQTISNGQWNKKVVEGNTTTQTYSSGAWYKWVVDGNTTIHTNSYNERFRTVVDGNTTTETNLVTGRWEKWVVDGDTRTTTSSDGSKMKRVVDRQETTIYITQERG
jgi:hypothetical protein